MKITMICIILKLWNQMNHRYFAAGHQKAKDETYVHGLSVCPQLSLESVVLSRYLA